MDEITQKFEGNDTKKVQPRTQLKVVPFLFFSMGGCWIDAYILNGEMEG